MNATRIRFAGPLLGASLSALLALSSGCAGDTPVPDGEDPVDPGDPDDPDPEPPERPLDASGTYRLDSRFDMVTGMPGEVGQVANTFIDMTDDPYDPATWLLDAIVAEVDNSFIRGAINAGRPILDALLYDLMRQHAPQIVSDLVQLGDHFGQVSRRFGVLSSLEVAADPDGAVATHEVTGYHFEVDGVEVEYDIAELGSDPVVVEGVEFGFASDRISVAEHSVPLRYGGFLALALDDVLVPLVEPDATSLADLFDILVDCDAIGIELSYEIGFGSPGFYAGLCELGLDAGAAAILDQLISIDEKAQVTLVIAGAARATDQDGDRRIDRLTGGTWSGAIDYAGSRGELPEDSSTFTGERR